MAGLSAAGRELGQRACASRLPQGPMQFPLVAPRTNASGAIVMRVRVETTTVYPGSYAAIVPLGAARTLTSGKEMLVNCYTTGAGAGQHEHATVGRETELRAGAGSTYLELLPLLRNLRLPALPLRTELS